MIEGLLLVHKPPGMTSHDVVQVVRRKLSIQRIGHTGTLDPMAEGLLMLLIGRATRYQQAFQTHEKTYEAVLRLGTQTDTGDATGAPVRTSSVPMLDRRIVADTLSSFKGPISQTPPAYSAVKIRGRPAYWWARRHQPVALDARIVHISDIVLIDCHDGAVTFRVQCSAGTYIRSLAEAIAHQLGTTGHLTRLIRLRIGDWSLEEAQSMAWIRQASPQALSHQLLPIANLHPSAT